MASFQSGAYSFNFPSGRLLPFTDELVVNQKRYLTEDNKPKIYQMIGKARIFNLQFVNLSASELEDLMTFFKDIDYSSGEITFYDDTGNDWDCYLWQDSIPFERKENMKFNVNLTLFCPLSDSAVGVHV